MTRPEVKSVSSRPNYWAGEGVEVKGQFLWVT